MSSVIESNHWLIFVCHSGAQKDFSHQLWVDFLAHGRHAFIDIESIPRARNFPEVIFNAVAECHVVVLVLSKEFFTRSIWPMLEIQAALRAKSSGKNPHLKLLPLFFHLSTEDMKDPEFEWHLLRTWEKWAATDDRVNIAECRKVYKILRSYNGLVFRQGMGEVEYRRMIVEAICAIVPPCFTADLTHVQGAERICQEMMNKIGQLPPKEIRQALDTRILAAYGGLGLGKTTLSLILCNYFRKQVGWRVHRIEIGGALDLLALQKLELKHLTGAPQSLLEAITSHHEGLDLLKKRIKGKRIFLAIDNASSTESSIQTTCMFLSLGLGKDSLVLVTACSHQDLLEMIDYDIFGQCFHLPNLTEEEAISILLDRAIPNCSFTSLSDLGQQIIRHCTSLCKIECAIQRSSGLNEGQIVKYHYHPLSLIKMGAELGGNSNIWVHKLKLLPNFSEQDSVNTIIYPFLKGQRHAYGGRHVPGEQHQPSAILSGIKWDSEGWGNLHFMKERFLCLNPFNRKHNNSHKQNPQALPPSLNAYPGSSSDFRKSISRIRGLIKKIK